VNIIEARDEALKYLVNNTRGRQEVIAEELGIRRETLNRYACGSAVPVDINCCQRIIEWVRKDREKKKARQT
jgi:hypothetical protein